MPYFFALLFLLILSCSTTYNLTDTSGNNFIIENPKLETKGNLLYKAGEATRELALEDIVSLSITNINSKILDGKMFYAAVLELEDTVSVPKNGFICVEETITAENADRKFSIPLANVKEISRPKEEK